MSVTAVREMLAHGDAFVKVVVTKGQDVAGVAHMGRRRTAYQKTALDWTYPTCANEVCGARGEVLQTDHREGWAKTHVTDLKDLDRLCRYDHWCKTYLGWALVVGKGKRAFVPPDDPRHTRNTRPTRNGGIAGAGPPGPPAPSGSPGSPHGPSPD